MLRTLVLIALSSGMNLYAAESGVAAFTAPAKRSVDEWIVTVQKESQEQIAIMRHDYDSAIAN